MKNRLQILELLQTGEKCACVLLEDLNISQPTLSHHMKILCESGIVAGRKEGKWTHYSISSDGAEAAEQLAEALYAKGAQLGAIPSFMMAVTTLSLSSMIMLRKAVKPKLLALFIGICAAGIILVGYLFNAIQFLL